ncbi:MAG: ATP-grasp domain-containing protein, partial [Bdellovibrionaceae bacterium]|nr:ATP-grasp domain-containing protein [Pseudobdellovibrionaceae bacterium]
FRTIDNAKDAEQAYTHFQGQLVFKKRRFGYDGYGTYVVRRTRDLRRAIEAIEAAIGNKPDGANHGFIAEAFVPFKRELALMIARNASGATSIFPMVETHQQNARCLWVKGPLRDTRGGTALTKRFSAALDELRYEGILGVELFEAPQGLLVNELAPRVHNSAHYSLDALAEDQFTVHWKAVLNLTLSPSRMLSKGFAMYNLLGQHARKPSWALPPGVHLHWYGKQENRPGRKMGHITSLGSSANAALKIAQSARKEFDV